MSEKELETRILDWLNSIKGCFAFKVNTTGIFDPKKKVYRKITNPHIHKGTPDIIFCYEGTFGVIEVKWKYNKPTENQNKFIQRIKRNGGVAWWFNDFDKCKQTFLKRFTDCEYNEKPIFDELF